MKKKLYAKLCTNMNLCNYEEFKIIFFFQKFSVDFIQFFVCSVSVSLVQCCVKVFFSKFQASTMEVQKCGGDWFRRKASP